MRSELIARLKPDRDDPDGLDDKALVSGAPTVSGVSLRKL
jgi:hypothetical protein